MKVISYRGWNANMALSSWTKQGGEPSLRSKFLGYIRYIVGYGNYNIKKAEKTKYNHISDDLITKRITI
jgi:hypothetical protein